MQTNIVGVTDSGDGRFYWLSDGGNIFYPWGNEANVYLTALINKEKLCCVHVTESTGTTSGPEVS